MRKTPVVLGVLSIIFGSLTTVLSLLTAFIGPSLTKLTQFAANLPSQGELQRAQMEAAAASFSTLGRYIAVSAAIFSILSIALVVIGVGLYRRRPWARRASIAWSLVGIAFVIASFVFTVGYAQPQQREVQHAIYAAHGVTPPFELSAAAQTAMVLFSSLLNCAFPAVLLALIGRRSAVADFLPATVSTPAA